MRALKGTEALQRSARERRKVEMALARLKRNLGFRRLRLRGITGAADEFLPAATFQNLNKLARFVAYHPPISASDGARNLNRSPLARQRSIVGGYRFLRLLSPSSSRQRSPSGFT